MAQRHRKSGFLPHAWVFPGGRVDDADAARHPRVSGGGSAAARMGVSLEEALPYLVAAARETFEEVGVWLGSGTLPAESRVTLQRGEIDLVSLLEQHHATLSLDVLVPWSRWITPKQEKRRYDTWFLVARAPSLQAEHEGHELVDSAWLEPRAALHRADAGGLPMAPPTWWTLRELAEHDSVDAVLRARQGPIVPIEPVLAWSATELALILPGHPDHPVPERVPGLPTRVVFSQGRWWAAP